MALYLTAEEWNEANRELLRKEVELNKEFDIDDDSNLWAAYSVSLALMEAGVDQSWTTEKDWMWTRTH